MTSATSSGATPDRSGGEDSRRDTAPNNPSLLPKQCITDAGPAVLARPDGYIAWAGASSDSGAMNSVLSRWTGLSRRPPCASPRGS
ncbi:MAG: hypothetical protein QOJ24_5377 [Mycobacterium sp.]|nr:hypothetical protein [Mycobacterium sp.]